MIFILFPLLMLNAAFGHRVKETAAEGCPGRVHFQEELRLFFSGVRCVKGTGAEKCPGRGRSLCVFAVESCYQASRTNLKSGRRGYDDCFEFALSQICCYESTDRKTAGKSANRLDRKLNYGQ